MSVHITETEWWNDLCEGIFGARKGGARIIVDAEDASTGVGKTGLAVFLARLLSKAFEYELQEEDLTLSGAHYLRRWREHPGAEQPSVIILDELGGAGAGHARRAMSTQNVELGNAWQLMRKKRIVSIVTLPHWSKADKDMRQQADYRLWCRKDPIGYFQPYDVGADFDNGEVNTEGYDDVERINFPNMDKHDDPFYVYLSERKDELLDSQYFDADKLADGEDEEELMSPDDARRKERIEIAQRKRNNGDTTREIADDVGMSHTWVIENTEPPEGEA
jgi:hypothetical protein